MTVREGPTWSRAYSPLLSSREAKATRDLQFSSAAQKLQIPRFARDENEKSFSGLCRSFANKEVMGPALAYRNGHRGRRECAEQIDPIVV